MIFWSTAQQHNAQFMKNNSLMPTVSCRKTNKEKIENQDYFESYYFYVSHFFNSLKIGLEGSRENFKTWKAAFGLCVCCIEGLWKFPANPYFSL